MLKLATSCAPEWMQVLDSILRHVQQTEELLCIVRSSSTHDRLLQLLIWLARKFARKVEQGHLIDLRLTHQDISEIIGTTRVTVTRLLSAVRARRNNSSPPPSFYCFTF